MSYRYVLQPERASGQVLESLTRRLDALERRTRGSGATLFEELTSTVYLVDDAWTDTLSIELDPGRWMLYGAATAMSPATHQLIQIRFPSPADSVPAGSSTYLSGYGDGTLNLSVIGSVALTGGGTFSMQGWSTASSNGVYITEAFIIAVPT